MESHGAGHSPLRPGPSVRELDRDGNGDVCQSLALENGGLGEFGHALWTGRNETRLVV